jgi:hydrogenase nickel incorporation protein HypA/HybF
MHELSIAEAVVEIALRHAAGRPVDKVELRVGRLRQVVPSALEFAFELLSEGTELQGAELAIEEVPARGRCRACETHSTMATFPLQCSSCGGLDVEIESGEELLVEAIELEDETIETPRRNHRRSTEGMAYGR